MSRSEMIDSLKHQLADALCVALGDCSLEQAMFALRLHPSDVSRLRRGILRQFSVTRLLRLVAQLGYDVEVSLRRRPRPQVIRPRPSARLTVWPDPCEGTRPCEADPAAGPPSYM